jgi:hypothetical protein
VCLAQLPLLALLLPPPVRLLVASQVKLPAMPPLLAPPLLLPPLVAPQVPLPPLLLPLLPPPAAAPCAATEVHPPRHPRSCWHRALQPQALEGWALMPQQLVLLLA